MAAYGSLHGTRQQQKPMAPPHGTMVQEVHKTPRLWQARFDNFFFHRHSRPRGRRWAGVLRVRSIVGRVRLALGCDQRVSRTPSRLVTPIMTMKPKRPIHAPSTSMRVTRAKTLRSWGLPRTVDLPPVLCWDLLALPVERESQARLDSRHRDQATQGHVKM